MIGTPEKEIKVSFKTNNYFNSTMTASFLPVIVSKKNKQTEKNLFYCSVSQIHIGLNPEKKHEKNIKMTIWNVPTLSHHHVEFWVGLKQIHQSTALERTTRLLTG